VKDYVKEKGEIVKGISELKELVSEKFGFDFTYN